MGMCGRSMETAHMDTDISFFQKPRTLRLSFVIPVVVLMITLAIGAELVYVVSRRNNGFPFVRIGDLDT